MKAVVKLYKQRMLYTPALQLSARMEECVITLMDTRKTCKAAFELLCRSVAKITWHEGPWQLGHIMSSFFAIGSPLNHSMHEQWAPLNVQTAIGQTIALDIGYVFLRQMGINLIVRMSGLWFWWLVVCG